MTSSSLRHILQLMFACGLALWLPTAGALPVSTGGVTSGFRGDTVSPTLFDDSVDDFEAADLLLTFDPVYLTFTGAAEGTLTSGFSVVPGNPMAMGSLMEVLISLATSGSPVTGGPGSMLVASFLINNAAPFGTTLVDFETVDTSLYDFSPASATITVLDRGASVPIGDTGALMLIGLAALFGLRRCTISQTRAA